VHGHQVLFSVLDAKPRRESKAHQNCDSSSRQNVSPTKESTDAAGMWSRLSQADLLAETCRSTTLIEIEEKYELHCAMAFTSTENHVCLYKKPTTMKRTVVW